MMNKQISNKITNLNFILSILIIIIHASCLRFIDQDANIFVTYFYKVIDSIVILAVPTFFALSGYLFCRNIKQKDIIKKIKSRFHTLVIPYFLWGIIFLIYYTIIVNIP